MALKTIGRMDYCEGRGAMYFCGYCSYCGKKHYLGAEETRQFSEEVKYHFVRQKINPFRLAFLPRPEVVELEQLPVKEKVINWKFFDVKYQDRGGQAWLNTDRYTLQEIANHYGFSVEYARRVRDGFDNNFTRSIIKE